MHRILFRRVVLTLAALAWLLGASWHGSMGVQAAWAGAGVEVCTLQGMKRVPAGGEPVSPAKSAQVECTLCAAFSAPGVLSGLCIDPRPVAQGSALIATPAGAILPATHLADLASRAPPGR
jgi:hypothetical protein